MHVGEKIFQLDSLLKNINRRRKKGERERYILTLLQPSFVQMFVQSFLCGKKRRGLNARARKSNEGAPAFFFSSLRLEERLVAVAAMHIFL